MKEVASPECQNEKMQLKNLSFLEYEVGIPDHEHPCAKHHNNPAKHQKEANSKQTNIKW